MTRQRESKLSGDILDALRAEGLFAFKVHGSALMMSGLPDLIACVDGQYIGLEIKLPESRKNVSEIQSLRHDQIKQAGGVAEVVCGVAEALAVIERVRGEQRIDPFLSGALGKLESLRARRMAASTHDTGDEVRGRRIGEINGIDMAIMTLKGEI